MEVYVLDEADERLSDVEDAFALFVELPYALTASPVRKGELRTIDALTFRSAMMARRRQLTVQNHVLLPPIPS